MWGKREIRFGQYVGSALGVFLYDSCTLFGCTSTVRKCNVVSRTGTNGGDVIRENDWKNPLWQYHGWADGWYHARGWLSGRVHYAFWYRTFPYYKIELSRNAGGYFGGKMNRILVAFWRVLIEVAFR